jgi:hypothetical protein
MVVKWKELISWLFRLGSVPCPSVFGNVDVDLLLTSGHKVLSPTEEKHHLNNSKEWSDQGQQNVVSQSWSPIYIMAAIPSMNSWAKIWAAHPMTWRTRFHTMKEFNEPSLLAFKYRALATKVRNKFQMKVALPA